MPMDTGDVTSTINFLIETCVNESRGFIAAADGVDDDEVRGLFQELSGQRKAFAEELQRELRSAGGNPEDTATAGRAVQRGWINIESARSGGKLSVLEECDRSEDMTAEIFENALRKDLPERVGQVVERQYQEIARTRERLGKLLEHNTK